MGRCDRRRSVRSSCRRPGQCHLYRRPRRWHLSPFLRRRRCRRFRPSTGGGRRSRWCRGWDNRRRCPSTVVSPTSQTSVDLSEPFEVSDPVGPAKTNTSTRSIASIIPTLEVRLASLARLAFAFSLLISTVSLLFLRLRDSFHSLNTWKTQKKFSKS